MLENADPVSRAFLNVERSAIGQRWVARLDQAGENRALAMSQTHGLPDLISRVLAGRGVPFETALEFLDPTLRRMMPEPYGLMDCEAATERLARAIEGVPAEAVPPLVLAKGSYFGCAGKPAFTRLIYPAPVDGGLGVHLTLDLAGRMRFGPDVEWLDQQDPGKVDYSVDPRRCDCSICRRKGAVVASVPLAGLRVVQGEEHLRLYQFNTRVARHYFCGVCGIYTHHQRRSSPNQYGYNVGCLESIDPFLIGDVPVNDGVSHPADRAGATR